MATDRQALIDMSFAPALVDQALKATKNCGLQAALDWLVEHPDGVTEESLADSANDAPSKPEEPARPPLTAEERAAQSAALEKRLAARREERKKEEAEAEREREKQRRVSGMELNQARELRDEQEHKALLAAKIREKEADRLARERVRQQIAEDRAERQRKQEEARRRRSGSDVPAAGGAARTPISAPTNASANSGDYADARIQIRARGSAPLTHVFAADETVATVRDWAAEKFGVPLEAVRLFATFPRSELTLPGTVGKTLRSVGLVPSGALICE